MRWSGLVFVALSISLVGCGGGARRLNLSEADKQALEAFMGTLTDTTLMADPKFSTPFTN